MRGDFEYLQGVEDGVNDGAPALAMVFAARWGECDFEHSLKQMGRGLLFTSGEALPEPAACR